MTLIKVLCEESGHEELFLSIGTRLGDRNCLRATSDISFRDPDLGDLGKVIQGQRSLQFLNSRQSRA